MPTLVDSLYLNRAVHGSDGRLPRRFDSVPAGGDAFNSWSELEAFAKRKLELSCAAICLLPDFVGSDSPSSLASMSVTMLDNRSLLIETVVGYRSRLVIHLERSTAERRSTPWPPQDFYEFLVGNALAVFSRNVSDRVVELMADKTGHQVAWLYLDEKGRVESASRSAADFCARMSSGRSGVEGYLPQNVSRYVMDLIARFGKDSEFPPDSLAFAISGREGLANCLLRRMAGEGYLLSLWREA